MQWKGLTLWFNERSQTVCADTHGGNILVDEAGGFAAIDVPVMLWPSTTTEM
jgi:predicted unusual protein kinase regulating ubiquinone biosynthesis (AarF/ABC1/UbiB family)